MGIQTPHSTGGRIAGAIAAASIAALGTSPGGREEADSPDIAIVTTQLEGVPGFERGRAFTALSPDGRRCFISAPNVSKVWSIDVGMKSVIGEAATPSPGKMVATDKHLWVAGYNSNDIVILGADSLKRESGLRLDTRVAGMAYHDGKVYVAPMSMDPVLVYNAATLKPAGQLKVPGHPRRGAVRTVEQMKQELERSHGWVTQVLDQRDKTIAAGKEMRERVVELKTAVATPGLNEIGREVLGRELELTETRIASSLKQFEASERRIDELRKNIATLEKEIKAIEAPVAPPAGLSVADLKLKFGTATGNRYFHDRDEGLTDLSFSSDGRYAFANIGSTVKFLVDGDQLIQMEAAASAGDGRLYKVGQVVQKPGTQGEGYKMNAYSAADLEYKIATYETGAYPRASTVDPSFSFFYGHDYDIKLHIYDIWSGARLETSPITRRGDTTINYHAIGPGRVLLCLESGAYIADVSVTKGTWRPGWKLNTLPEVVARVDKPWTYRPKLLKDQPGAKWVLESQPEGLKFDPATGAMSWTPTEAQLGRHSALLRIEPPDGAFDSAIRQPIIVHVAP